MKTLSSDVTEIFILGIPEISKVEGFSGVLGAVADRHAARLNRAIVEVCGQDARLTYVPFLEAAARNSRRFRSAADYEKWGEAIAASLAPALDKQHAASEIDATVRNRDERARQHAVDEMQIVDTDPNEALDILVNLARTFFQTRAAAISIISHDREWHKSRIGEVGEEIPRTSSFCSVTIGGWGPLVVPNALQDDRFSNNPQVVGDPRIRFYAGYPIQSPSGHRIGALCVFDPEPRESEEVDRAVLRELTLLVQKEIWRASAH